jgi:hypothetical protein
MSPCSVDVAEWFTGQDAPDSTLLWATKYAPQQLLLSPRHLMKHWSLRSPTSLILHKITDDCQYLVSDAAFLCNMLQMRVKMLSGADNVVQLTKQHLEILVALLSIEEILLSQWETVWFHCWNRSTGFALCWKFVIHGCIHLHNTLNPQNKHRTYKSTRAATQTWNTWP